MIFSDLKDYCENCENCGNCENCENFNKYIKNIIMELFNQKKIKFVTKPNNKYVYEFTPPEWYNELDSYIQSCVYLSIQATLKFKILNEINEINKM